MSTVASNRSLVTFVVNHFPVGFIWLHNRIHSNERLYRCDICNKAFVHSSNLARLKLRIHSTERPNVNKEDDYDVLSSLISSQLCNAGHEMFRGADVQQTDDTERIYNSNTCEQMHGYSTFHKTHTADKSHECDVCHQTFRHLSFLNRHKYVHNGIKQFTCDICNKAFSREYNLTIHKRIHSGEKAYVCDVCFLAFTRLGSLNSHKDAVHNGVKRFTCDICNKAFARSYDMTIHKRIHSGERPYACDVCFLAFTDVSSLNRHKRNIHSSDKP